MCIWTSSIWCCWRSRQPSTGRCNTTGSPEQIAHDAVYLASDEAAFGHGIVLDVDSGRTEVAAMAA
jgi:hypothetical protein